tara:strand:- start:99 stop:878 length:780 start_codon:yes stop_codon:yes gene_type:complete
MTIPRTSFLKIEVGLIVRICSGETGACEFKHKPFISGSGFVVNKGRYKGSYIMSAGHVCDPSAIAGIVAGGNPWDLELSGITKEKEKYKLIVLEVDNDKDLCLLYAPDLERIPIKVAESKLLPGSKIWNIAAPSGILFRGAPVIIDGIFNGTNLDSGHDMYTMFVAGGSSGSAILNEKGEVVGLVSMMDLRFPFIVYSPSHEDISEFLHRAMAYHKNIGAPRNKIYRIGIVLPELPEIKLPKLPKIPDLSDIIKEWLSD